MISRKPLVIARIGPVAASTALIWASKTLRVMEAAYSLGFSRWAMRCDWVSTASSSFGVRLRM
jgi:hypothetical protein